MDLVKKTQKKVEGSKKKLSKTMKLKSYKKLAINFLILTVNLIIIILYFSLSQAKVEIAPVKTQISHSSSIAISDPASDSAKENTNQISVPGKIMNVETGHEKTFKIDSTSKIEKHARGEITIYNTTSNRDQIFVRDTRFKNSKGVLIKTERKVQIPPGGQVTISAYADKKGEKGEITPEDGKFQVVALPYLKDKIYAEAASEFTGGMRISKVLTADEFNKAEQKMREALKEKAMETFATGTENKINKNNLRVEIKNIKSSANPGDEGANEFTIKADAKISAFSYDIKAVKNITKQQLIKKIPPDKILISFIEDSFETSINKEKKEIKASISANIQTKIPETILNQKDIAGMNQEEVQEYFTRITGIKDVKVKLWPFWVRSVPSMEDHVDIEITQ